MEEKRLFFGAEVSAVWPEKLPPARIIEEASRHITLAFLGNTSLPDLLERLREFPKPPFRIGLSGKCDKFIFLPDKHHARVIAGEISWLSSEDQFGAFRETFAEWLGLEKEKRKFIPHLTIARTPFDVEQWSEIACQIPFFVSAIHLYESMGNLTYIPRWTYSFFPPFEEIEHTADIAFRIRGEDLSDIFLHAQLALAFKSPSLVAYISAEKQPQSLDEIIMALNQIVSISDLELGSPFKAVSYHGKLVSKDNLLEWTMIVDV